MSTVFAMSTIAASEEGLSTREIARLSGATYRQLDYWCRTDLLVPELRPARGSGSQRFYSQRDAALACMIISMRDQGLSLAMCGRIVSVLRSDPDAWDSFVVLVDGAIVVTDTPGAVLADSRSVFAWILSPASMLDVIEARRAEGVPRDDVRAVRS